MVIFPIEKRSQVDVLVVSAIFTFLPTLAVSLRILARRIANRSLDASDYAIILACGLANGLQTIPIVGVVQCGVGFHITDIVATYGMDPVTKFFKLLIPVQLLWALSLSCCKISILLMYTRIFTMRTMIVASWVTSAVIVAWALATVLSGFFICRPFAKNWLPNLEGTCGDQRLSYTITGSLNLVTDLVAMVLPLPYLWGLRMQLKKLLLAIAFSMGIFTCVISIMRLISLQEIDYADITFNIPHALIFGALEPSVGVTLACLPLLRPLLRRQDYSTDGSKRYNVSGQDEHEHTGSATARGGLGGHQKDGFTTIDDDSEHQLRPVGPKHHVAIKSKRRDDGRMSSDNDESIGEEQAGIFVRQEWSVTK